MYIIYIYVYNIYIYTHTYICIISVSVCWILFPAADNARLTDLHLLQLHDEHQGSYCNLTFVADFKQISTPCRKDALSGHGWISAGGNDTKTL